MDILTPKDLQKLSQEHSDFCLTICLPTTPIEDKTKQNPVSLRDTLDLAEKMLRERKVDKNRIEVWLKLVTELSYDVNFWLSSSISLFVFVSDNEFFAYRLPLEVKAEVFVQKYYYILPLVQLLDNPNYYILDLDERGVKFYQANLYKMRELSSKPLLSLSIDGVKAKYQREEVQGFRTEKRGGRDPRKHESIVYHGHSNEKDDQKIRINQYMTEIINALPKVLSEDETPLIVVGNEYLSSAFRNNYPYHNLEATIAKDTQLLSKEQLHKLTVEKITDLIQVWTDAEKELYQDLKATEMISNELDTILPAAFYGRVFTLFCNRERREWGNFNVDNGDLTWHQKKEPDDEELINLAAIQTFENDGTLCVLNLAEMPDKTSLNAIFRY